MRHTSIYQTVAVMIGAVCVILGGPGTDRAAADESQTYWVSAKRGDDDNPGTKQQPLRHIDTALKKKAEAGDTVRVEPGTYRESIRTYRSGEPDAPITITGPPEAVLNPDRDDDRRAVRLFHSYVHLTGLTIDGLRQPERKFEDYRAWIKFAVQATPARRKSAGEDVDYLYGLKIEPHRIGGSQMALISAKRIRTSSIGGFKIIRPVGMRFDPRVSNHEIGHVREIVYLGMATGSIGEGHDWYPWDTIDRTRNVRIHHIDNSEGHAHGELVDIKLGCSNVTVEYCTDRNAGHHTDATQQAAISMDGKNCTIRWNDIGDCTIPLNTNPWSVLKDVSAKDWALGHRIYGNYFHDFQVTAFSWEVTGPGDQRTICGNRIEGDGDYSYNKGNCSNDVPSPPDGIGHKEKTTLEAINSDSVTTWTREAGEDLSGGGTWKNLLANPGFEAPLRCDVVGNVHCPGIGTVQDERLSWLRTVSSGYEIERTNKQVHAGKHACAVKKREQYYQGAAQEVTEQLRTHGPGRYRIAAAGRAKSGKNKQPPILKMTLMLHAGETTKWFKINRRLRRDKWVVARGAGELDWSGSIDHAFVRVETERGRETVFVDDVRLSVQR